ncbi:MAG: hypothetical protein MK193_01060 [Lentisphaeria bacterium]|nr:hypothetical protein [Lentisphaeria bacterium]
MKFLNVHFKGVYKPKTLSSTFVEDFVKRVETSLIPGSGRSDYKIKEANKNSLSFHSNSFLTNINVGFNDVTISVDHQTGKVHYNVYFKQWANYCF